MIARQAGSRAGSACSARVGAARHVAPRSRANLHVSARFGGGRGNVLDRPDIDVGKRLGGFDLGDWNLGNWNPRTDSGRNGAGLDKDKQSPPGGGNYRVILVDSPQHSEKGVVRGITSVVPNTDEAHARNCFNTSKQLGMAIVTTCLKEHAEFYQQQLYMSYAVRTSIEPDSTTA